MITDGPGGFGNYLQGIFFTYIFVHFLCFLGKQMYFRIYL